MSITRSKLIKYLAVFRKHIPGDTTHELHQAMDGIEEVQFDIKATVTQLVSVFFSYIFSVLVM